MLNTLIEIEKQRLVDMGYLPVVSIEDILIDDNVFTKSLGNDTLIIAGIVFDSDTVSGDKTRITIASATDCISGDASNLSAYGNGTYKIMRQYLDVTRYPESKSTPYVINVIKITPKRR